jgi:hypothetical protein
VFNLNDDPSRFSAIFIDVDHVGIAHLYEMLIRFHNKPTKYICVYKHSLIQSNWNPYEMGEVGDILDDFMENHVRWQIDFEPFANKDTSHLEDRVFLLRGINLTYQLSHHIRRNSRSLGPHPKTSISLRLQTTKLLYRRILDLRLGLLHNRLLALPRTNHPSNRKLVTTNSKVQQNSPPHKLVDHLRETRRTLAPCQTFLRSLSSRLLLSQADQLLARRCRRLASQVPIRTESC